MSERPEFSPYSPACWQRFVAPAHAGPPAADTAVVEGRALGRDRDTEVRFWLAREGQRAWFQVHGSPWTVAAAELLCEYWQAGRPVPGAQALQEALAAPMDRMDSFLTVEDAWQSARQALDGQSSEV